MFKIISSKEYDYLKNRVKALEEHEKNLADQVQGLQNDVKLLHCRLKKSNNIITDQEHLLKEINDLISVKSGEKVS